jgi:2-polyprenyl-6-methoxyphenol hydroxylase-like FAD-dependent oxidoreductase
MSSPQESEPVVIVGAGPAGMMLAYQLVAHGIPVRVLERHKSFSREFRGEFVQPSVLSVLDQLELMAELKAREAVAPIRAVRMHRGARAFATSVGPDGGLAGQAVHQPTLLALLEARCARHPGFRLDMETRVDRLLVEDGRAKGVVIRRGDQEEPVGARLVVVCNGRNSSLRQDLGLATDELESPYSLLWLRFDLSSRPELYPDTLDGFLSDKAFCVLYPTHGRRVQLMWRRSRKHALDWKSPPEALRAALLEDTPEHWHPFVESLDGETERAVLRVVCDRLRRWWAPGVLFLGDAAHTMSPVGGQGVSMAVRDAIVAANHLIPAARSGQAIDDALLAAIEAERRVEIEAVQTFQMRAGKINDAPPVVQWLMARAVVPLITKLQGASYLRGLQHGFTDVRMQFAPMS